MNTSLAIFKSSVVTLMLIGMLACSGGSATQIQDSGQMADVGGVDQPMPDTMEPDTGGDDRTNDSVTTADTSENPDSPGGPDSITQSVKPINEVLSCGRPALAGGLSEGKQIDKLLRSDIDLTAFPNARCNDGTAAVFYYRPYVGETNKNRWVIQLQGGGGCRTPESCARRWCRIDTNFGMTQMTSNLAPKNGIDGKGILQRRSDNPVGNYNQIFIRYCSSDAWSGTRGPVSIHTTDPAGQLGEVNFTLQFNGRRIVEAVVNTLRREKTPALTYDNGQLNVEMPDLDSAEFVLLAGASAGGGGVINNTDHLRQLLETNNDNCQGGGPCPLQFAALIDSVLAPHYSALDFSTSSMCVESQLCSYQELMEWNETDGGTALWHPKTDDSCRSWHEQHAPDTEWQCNDGNHLLFHHITTPFFVRMGLTDSLISGNYVDAGFSVPGEGVLTLKLFAGLVRKQLLELASIQKTGHEGDQMLKAPGAYGPPCGKHETLRSTANIFDVTIEAGGTDYSMFETMLNWLANKQPSSVVTQSMDTSNCPK